MADKAARTVSDGESSAKNAQYNPKLDFYSEEFDPLLALRTPGVVVPTANAATYDNISKYYSVYCLKRNILGEKGENKRANSSGKEKEEEVHVDKSDTIVRRWQPHQLPIKTERIVVNKNIFTKMDAVEGPLKLLRDCKDKRLRIKVWTRHSHAIRGYCLAYIVAFDKHWNLALEEVEEIWTRARRRKIPALDSAKENARIKLEIKPPPVTILKTTKKTETCSRHVDKMVLRGEHVAFIVVMPKEDERT